ncbi:unnamed protein product [Closterium sp. Naga37s-1]|nr:unnamed protein product [Closterium sp. Naga37s-1]
MRAPIDLLLRDYLKEKGLHAYVHVPSLFQHMGVYSTKDGSSKAFHFDFLFGKNASALTAMGGAVEGPSASMRWDVLVAFCKNGACRGGDEVIKPRVCSHGCRSCYSDLFKPSSSGSSGAASSSVVAPFIEYLNNSWTQFHATASARDLLRAAGYEQLRESDAWQLKPGGKYFFTRNLSSIVAFAVGEKASPASLPLRIVAAHTDSPCLKLKPVSAATKGGCLSLAVQTYGGGLWHTWFDRDLSLAGRVLVQGEDGRVAQRLVKIDRPILRIPTLAIHLDRNVNTDGFKPNAETHLVPVLATHIKAQLRANNGAAASNGAGPGSGGRLGAAEGGAAAAAAAARLNGKTNGTGSSNGSGGGGGGGNGNGNGNGNSEHHPLLLELLAEELSCSPSAILDFELNVCDTQRSVAGAGGAGEFVFSGRLDNLACCYTALQALIDAEGLQEERGVRVVALFDNEEVGSESVSGAASPAMYNAIKRIVKQMPGVEAEEGAVERSFRASFLVSADMAHALHPNYPEKHEERHQPRMGAGMVVKHNANQRYATNLVSSFLFKHLAAKHGLPCQSFVVRNDMGCGSTIGPILASGLGIRTVDVGIPQLSMHSIREMCASDDIDTAYHLFKAFLPSFHPLCSSAHTPPHSLMCSIREMCASDDIDTAYHLFKAFYSTAFAEVEDSMDLDE